MISSLRQRVAGLGRWSGPRRERLWLIVVLAAATIPVAGVFTLTRAFLVRDLSVYFWPRYLWLRHTVWSGESPWWDPFVAAGQAIAGDALAQMFLLPTLALRLLLPEPVGFNLSVALPMPLAAWGAYAFFRRHASPAAAALGALTFAASGPVLSTGTFLNLSWSMAFIPWILWATDRAASVAFSGRALVPVSLLFAGQICAGEPLTTAGTFLLALGYIATVPTTADDEGERLKGRVRRAARVAVALGVGAIVSGVQLVPLLWAARNSTRGVLDVNTEFWSVHPLSLLETIAPNVFGNAFVTFIAHQPWMMAFNGGRDPFFFSLYVGMGGVMVACLGMGHALRRRWSAFWLVVAAIALTAALGSYTPVLPTAQAAIPALQVFRFPAKYLLFVVFALAALVTAGWNTLEQRQAGEPSQATAPAWPIRAALALGGFCAIVGYAAAMLRIVAPDTFAWGLFSFAVWMRLPDPAAGAEFLYAEMVAQAARLFLLSALGAGLLWIAWTRRAEARTARWALFAMVIADLVVTNGSVNPTTPLTAVQEASWMRIARQHPHERFYFGGRFQGSMVLSDYDAPAKVEMPPGDTLQDTRITMGSRLVTVPSAFGLRELISHDLPSLFPRDYDFMTRLAWAADRDQRRRLFARTGVRYCWVREPLPAGATVLDRLPQFDGFAFYECNPQATRVYIAETAGILPAIEDQLKFLFRPEYNERGVLIQAQPPPPAGVAGAPVEPSARFVTDRASVVEVDAGIGAKGGYLVLLDSYDPDWGVEVDGKPAPLLRANGIFRAVHLAPGQHRVSFTYTPMPVLYGAGASALGGLGLLLMAWWPRIVRDRVSSPERVPLPPLEPAAAPVPEHAMRPVAAEPLHPMNARRDWLLVLAASLVATIPVWIPTFPPMTDMPQHAAHIGLLREMQRPGYPYESFFYINWFTPYLFGYLLVYGLVPVFGMVTAVKIVVSLALAALPLSTALVMNETGTDRRWAILAIPAMYGFSYHWGFLSFLVATPLGLVFLWLTLRQAKRPTTAGACALAAALHLLFFCHALICLFFGLMAGLVLLHSADTWRTRIWRILPLAAVVPIMVLWATQTMESSEQARKPIVWDLGWFATEQPYYALIAQWTTRGGWGWGRTAGFFPRLLGTLPGPLTTIAGLSFFLLPFAAGARVTRRLAIWIPFLVCLGAVLFMPEVLFGTDFTHGRFAVFALPLFLILLERPAQRAWPRWTWPACGLLVASWLGVVSVNAIRYEADAAGFDEILTRMEPGQRALSFAFERDSRGTIAPPFLHFPSWYTAVKAGLVDPSGAATPAPPVRYRAGREPAARVGGFEWVPIMFDWTAFRGADYRYFVARAPQDPGPFMFRTATCPTRLVHHVEHWWLYEAEPGCAPQQATTAPPASQAQATRAANGSSE